MVFAYLEKHTQSTRIGGGGIKMPKENKTYVVKNINGELCINEWLDKEPPLMKCGHTANATQQIPNNDNSGKISIHCCVICCGIVKGNNIVQDKPDLSGRKSQCSSCKGITDSKWTLPFFEYRPKDEYDGHYDGCFGWD